MDTQNTLLFKQFWLNINTIFLVSFHGSRVTILFPDIFTKHGTVQQVYSADTVFYKNSIWTKKFYKFYSKVSKILFGHSLAQHKSPDTDSPSKSYIWVAS